MLQNLEAVRSDMSSETGKKEGNKQQCLVVVMVHVGEELFLAIKHKNINTDWITFSGW
jgi:hypothetical protein